MEVLLFMSKTVEYWQLHIQPSVCVCVCVHTQLCPTLCDHPLHIALSK